MIELDYAEKRYTRRKQTIDALRPTSLTIATGEFVAVTGPSGSGKTTLLSMLGGMLSPTSGRVMFDGQSLYEMTVPERARIRNQRIGFVFQNFSLVPWLTAVENVQLPLCLYGTDTRVQQVRAREILTQFGLGDRLNHKPAELSAGQQQRTALARTLILNPALILADEPTGNLDPQCRDVVLRTLSKSHAEGRTIVMVTHDPAAAQSADRVLRIVDGVVGDSDSQEIAGAA